MIYDIDGIIKENIYGHTITLQGLHILVPCKYENYVIWTNFNNEFNIIVAPIIKGETIIFSLS